MSTTTLDLDPVLRGRFDSASGRAAVRVRTQREEGRLAGRARADVVQPLVRPLPAVPGTGRRPAVRPPTAHPGAGLSVVLVGCPQPMSAHAPQSGYRMGRWHRLAITMTVVAAGLIVALGVGSGSSGVDGTRTITVQSGQSLWSLASAGAGAGSEVAIAHRLEAIRQLNGLQGQPADAPLPAGSAITVPAAG